MITCKILCWKDLRRLGGGQTSFSLCLCMFASALHVVHFLQASQGLFLLKAKGVVQRPLARVHRATTAPAERKEVGTELPLAMVLLRTNESVHLTSLVNSVLFPRACLCTRWCFSQIRTVGFLRQGLAASLYHIEHRKTFVKTSVAREQRTNSE